ncbi:MAG: NUDIX hydrolase [Arenimonas sp.]
MPSETFERLQSVLLDEAAALRMPPHNLAEVEAFLPVAHAELAPAAVLCGLVPRADGLQVLLTKRAEHLRHHAGQISFPGGRMEPGDSNPLQTALREAQEEIGLAPEAARLLGYLEPMVTITGYRVYPVVAAIDPEYRAEPDGHEVSALFEAPLALFLDAGNERPFRIEFQGATRSLTAFDWQAHRIWGATASMLVNLRRRLMESHACR